MNKPVVDLIVQSRCYAVYFGLVWQEIRQYGALIWAEMCDSLFLSFCFSGKSVWPDSK